MRQSLGKSTNELIQLFYGSKSKKLQVLRSKKKHTNPNFVLFKNSFLCTENVLNSDPSQGSWKNNLALKFNLHFKHKPAEYLYFVTSHFCLSRYMTGSHSQPFPSAWEQNFMDSLNRAA